MGAFKVERTIHVPLEKVWAIAGDFTKSPDPSLPIAIVKKGDELNFGIGCERHIKSGRAVIHERLEAVDPCHSYTYAMLSGAPVKRYLAKVEFFAEGEGTHIKWSVDFIPKIPGTGGIIKSVIKKSYNKFIDEFEKIK